VATVGRTGTLIEWIQYTAYGSAITNPPGNADFNGDGGVDGSDTEAFFVAYAAGLLSADVNNDGSVTGDDVEAFDDIWDTGLYPTGGVGAFTAIRIGYAGYQWDGSVNIDSERAYTGAMAGLYHVRHRVYDPEMGRWTRRDPIGYVDGMGLYEYVGSGIVVGIDPSGNSYLPTQPSIDDTSCGPGWMYDAVRRQCVRIGAEVCCRQARVNRALTWIEHCEIVLMPPNESCESWAQTDPLTRSYPLSVSPSGSMPDGTPCSNATPSSIYNCLLTNPHCNGSTLPHSNCQTSVIDRQSTCCVTSDFYRQWYAHPAVYAPGTAFFRGIWLLFND